MPEAATLETTTEGTGTGNQPTQAPGWLAGLPADLRENEAFKAHKTVGDFAKVHLETAAKVKTLETKLQSSITKPGENATQEERDQYLNSLGRPEKPDQYEFEVKDDTEKAALQPWAKDFHELGLTKDQAKGLKSKWDARINAVVDQHNAKIQTMNTEAETKLKAEWGDKFTANVELAQRFWKKETDSELDKVFEGATSAQRLQMSRFIFKMAAKTGEDTSLPGSGQRGAAQTQGLAYPKSNMPKPR